MLSTLKLFSHLALERVSAQPLPRVPEPALVMDDPAQVDVFWQMGADGGVLSPIYLLLTVYAGCVMPAQGRVLDLACGPGNFLLELARQHPGCHFTGVDVAPNMLRLAETQRQRAGLAPIDWVQADIAELAGVPDASVDVVTCTLSLHHLADVAQLRQTMRAIRRVLKPDGRVFLVDFARLKRLSTLAFMVADQQAEQHELFSQDFMNSMRAAFTRDELQAAAAELGLPLAVHATALAPFMVVLQGPVRGQPDVAVRRVARARFAALKPMHQRQVSALANWFQGGGLTLPYRLRA